MNAVAPIESMAPIVGRIAEALRDDTIRPSGEWLSMREEAADLHRGMIEAAEDCERLALSPTNSVAEARTARQSAEDFRHEALRLAAAVATVDQVLPEVKAAEHKAAIMPAYLAFKDERAAFFELRRVN